MSSTGPVQAERSPREGVLAGPHCPAQHHGEPRHHVLQAQHHAPADLLLLVVLVNKVEYVSVEFSSREGEGGGFIIVPNKL